MSDNFDQIPAGYTTITPYVVLNGAAAAIEFYKVAFGATETFRILRLDGTIRHAEVKIGNSPLMVVDENPAYPDFMRGALTLGGSPIHLFLYVADVDTLVSRAVAAGAALLMAVADNSDGDRRGGIKDPFGIIWWVATRVKDVPIEEIQAQENN